MSIRLLDFTVLQDFINPISEMIETFLTVNIVLNAAMYIHAFATSIRVRIHAASFDCLVTRSTNDELRTTHCMGNLVITVSNNGFLSVTWGWFRRKLMTKLCSKITHFEFELRRSDVTVHTAWYYWLPLHECIYVLICKCHDTDKPGHTLIIEAKLRVYWLKTHSDYLLY